MILTRRAGTAGLDELQKTQLKTLEKLARKAARGDSKVSPFTSLFTPVDSSIRADRNLAIAYKQFAADPQIKAHADPMLLDKGLGYVIE